MSNIQPIFGTAVVKNNGALYTTYGTFAKAAGHPDAVNHSKPLEEGTTVELLAKGNHLSYGDTIYVVKDKYGVKHLIGGDHGLEKIHESSTVKIGDRAKLLTKDGALGGFTAGEIVTIEGVSSGRWNTKVRGVRGIGGFTHVENLEAIKGDDKMSTFKVGDKVKLTIAAGDRPKYGWGGVENGEIGVVRNILIDGNLYVDFPDFEAWQGLPSEFTLVTEEPTVEKPMFKTGDTVTLLDGGKEYPLYGYENGKEYTIKAMPDGHRHHFGKNLIQLIGGGYETGYARADQLALVTDVSTVATVTPVAADEIAELRSELTRLSERLDQLEKRQYTPTSRSLAVAVEAPTPVMSADEIRAKVVADAKADIESLVTTKRFQGVRNFKGRMESFYPDTHDKVEFVVNREKRTVVALIKYNNQQDDESGKTWAKGVSKCDPDDVFNEHIGKVIALHRAFGIDVPEKYLYVPKPFLAEVGDIVQGNYTKRTFRVDSYEDQYDGRKTYGTYIEDGADAFVPQCDYRIIDDSNREVR